MLAASNTSVRNSTVPAIPAGSPPLPHRSANDNDKSIRAVWVWTATGVTLACPNTSAVSVSLPCQFCQASIT
ncbi:hypothetical protein MYIN104542_30485 [Mycobacterium intermedium]